MKQQVHLLEPLPDSVRSARGESIVTPSCPFIPTERGVEKHVELDDLSAPEVEAKIARLLQS